MSKIAHDSTGPAHCLGPDYRPEEQKPTATVSAEIKYKNVHILPQTAQLIALLTYVHITPELKSAHFRSLSRSKSQYDTRSEYN